MLSTLTIVSIFTEIFAAGILLAGAYSFVRKYISQHDNKSLFLSVVFFTTALFVSLTVLSQMMYNMGRPVSELILVHKLIYVDITLGSLFLWLFSLEKFGYLKLLFSKMASVLVAILVAIIGLGIMAARLELIYTRDVIEPVVSFSLMVPSRSLWVLMWVILAGLSFANLFGSPEGRRNLLLLTAASSIFIIVSQALRLAYLGTADAAFLLVSWVITLFGVVGLLLAEIIPENSKNALFPINFFRERILYKLILIFVLLIVVLLEVTTLATIEISRESLVISTKNHHRSIAESVADKIEYAGFRGGRPNMEFIRALVSETAGTTRTIYVVDGSGKVVAHPQPASIGSDLSGVASVKKVLDGESGSLEYLSPLFLVPNDQVVGSFAPVAGANLGVVVEEPRADAYFEIRKMETNSLIFVIAGIALTIVVGVFFASSIEKPIRRMIEVTDAVRRGNLSHKIDIDSSDELGQLSQAFNQMMLELRDTQDHLVSSEKLAALGTMAAGMAHEIKNPLVSLRTFTQLLQQKFDDPDFRSKFSAIVPQEIEHINRIAESLLKFGKPTKPELTNVKPNKLIEEALDLLENECKRYNIRISTKLAAIPEIVGDPMQLSQAFVNIILNAIQAMPKGGELTVKTDVGEVVRLGRALKRKKKNIAKEEGAYSEGILEEAEEGAETEITEQKVKVVFVEITDTGVGIEEQSLKSLFDPFYTTKISGTGMGLPITLRIIEDHRGSVKVKSQVGKGTTFTVTLPVNLNEI